MNPGPEKGVRPVKLQRLSTHNNGKRFAKRSKQRLGWSFPAIDFRGSTDVTQQTIQNADFEDQIAGINRSQAVIEFNMDGMPRSTSRGFVFLRKFER